MSSAVPLDNSLLQSVSHYLDNSQTWVKLEKVLCVDKKLLFGCVLFLILSLLTYQAGTTLVSNLFMYVLPVYFGWQALKTDDPWALKRSVSYWVIAGLVNIVESFISPAILQLVNPQFLCIKLAFLLWCVFPATNGAQKCIAFLQHTLVPTLINHLPNMAAQLQQIRNIPTPSILPSISNFSNSMSNLSIAMPHLNMSRMHMHMPSTIAMAQQQFRNIQLPNLPTMPTMPAMPAMPTMDNINLQVWSQWRENIITLAQQLTKHPYSTNFVMNQQHSASISPISASPVLNNSNNTTNNANNNNNSASNHNITITHEQNAHKHTVLPPNANANPNPNPNPNQSAQPIIQQTNTIIHAISNSPTHAQSQAQQHYTRSAPLMAITPRDTMDVPEISPLPAQATKSKSKSKSQSQSQSQSQSSTTMPGSVPVCNHTLTRTHHNSNNSNNRDGGVDTDEKQKHDTANHNRNQSDAIDTKTAAGMSHSNSYNALSILNTKFQWNKSNDTTNNQNVNNNNCNNSRANLPTKNGYNHQNNPSMNNSIKMVHTQVNVHSKNGVYAQTPTHHSHAQQQQMIASLLSSSTAVVSAEQAHNATGITTAPSITTTGIQGQCPSLKAMQSMQKGMGSNNSNVNKSSAANVVRDDNKEF